MRKITLIEVLVTAACLTLAAFVPACSESKSRQNGQSLLDAAKEAQRLVNGALAYRSTPQFKDPNGSLPTPGLPKISANSQDKIVVLPPLQVNNYALDKLKMADANLAAAIKNNPDADPATKAIAVATLGDVNFAMGDLHAQFAGSLRAKLDNQLDLLQQQAAHLQSMAGVVQYFKQLEGVKQDETKAALDNAASEAQATETKLNEIKKNDADLQKKHDELALQSDKLSQEARALRSESQITPGQKGMDLLDAALEKEKQIDQNSTKISGIENEIWSAKVSSTDLSLRLAVIKARRDAAQASLDAANKSLDAQAKSRQDAEASIKKEQDNARAMIEQDSNTLAEIKDAVAKAAASYQTGISRMAEAAKLQPSPAYASHEASGHMSLANLAVFDVSIGERCELIAKSIRPLIGTPVPAGLDTLEKYISDSQKLIDQAKDEYAKAAALRENAVKAADSKHKWVYQFQLADAYIAQYRLTKDKTFKDIAIDAIDAASKGQENSPYIATEYQSRKAMLD